MNHGFDLVWPIIGSFLAGYAVGHWSGRRDTYYRMKRFREFLEERHKENCKGRQP